MSPERRGLPLMNDADIQREVEDSLCYNRNPLPSDEESSPSQVSKFGIEGKEFHRDVTDEYPICAGLYDRIPVTETREVQIVGYIDEADAGVQFRTSTDLDKFRQLKKFPTPPSHAREYFIRTGETTEDPEITNRLELIRKHKNSKRMDLRVIISEKK